VILVSLMLMAVIWCVASLASQSYVIRFLGLDVILKGALGSTLEDGIGSLNVDIEASIPTWFSSSVLLLCSVLLAAIASAHNRIGGRFVRQWSALSIIFLLLSLDEMAAFHERFIDPLRSLLDTGFFYSAWVILGGPFVIIVVLAYRRFLFNLPTKSSRLFIAAGALYVLGALGVEMLGGLQEDLYGQQNLAYVVLVTVEEFLEMSGAILFLYALMRYTEFFKEAGE
jgi:hypothetical protein